MTARTTIHVGDALAVLKTLPSESVQCIVTSPPYYGLRDYGESDQLGLEPTPDEYVARLVAVFAEARRVLRDDGVLWLNLGDSYASQGGPEPAQSKWLVDGASNGQNGGRSRRPGDLKPKDLIGIPWRVAFALQADGWWLRSDCIWHKPNPMPESVTDRPTKAHEYVFLLSKSARYFYDADAVAEESRWQPGSAEDAPRGSFNGKHGDNAFRAIRSARNRRTVWTITPQPYSGAHFATMPPDLVEVCVKAGSAAGDTVLDPFGGAGTTGLVANRLDRDAVLIELNADYAEMARERIYGDAPMFANVEVTTMQTDMIYWCPDCDICEHIDNLVSGCPNCGQTMIPAPPAEADTEVTP